MSHWWVCVNKPDRIDFGVRQHTFNNFADFAVLPMCGGFVVDIWGALWDDQDAANAPARAASNLGTAGDCVWDEPGDYLGNTGTVARAHFQYF